MRTPEAARALAEDIVRQVRSGGNWVELGAKYSSEPDLAKPVNANTITPSFDLPAGARERLFATLPSQVTDPIQMNDSYVIFRVEQLAATPLPQVRPALRSELQQARGGDQVAKIQQGIQARVVLQQFFKAAAPDPNTGQSSTDTIDPAAVVAEINGRKITAKELSEALQGMQPSSRVAASQNPQRFLIETETVRLLAEEARKAGLDTKPPASDMIRWANEQVLMQAELDEITKSISSSLEEQQTFFKANADQYRIAKTKLIYVPFSAAPPPGSKVRNEEQSKARADEAAKRAAAGTDFVQLVYEYSEEQASKADAGNFMDIALTDARVPEDVRKALFAVKPGDLAGPVRQPNGFYLFKVIDNGVRPFDEVRNDIYIKLSDEKFKKWFDDYRAKIQVAITDAPAINAELAYQK
jgi:parvulin-like peptidyl-prolyl isomerase